MPVWVSWWNVSQREDGFPEGRVPHWHDIFVLLYRTNPNLVKYQWKQQWLPVDAVRMVDVLPVDISPVDMMEWPTFVSQSRLTIFTWGIIICNRCSLTFLNNSLDIHNWSDYWEKGVGFAICKNLKNTIYSQINPISHLNSHLLCIATKWGLIKGLLMSKP